MKYLLLYFAVFLIGVNADLVTLNLQRVIERCKNYTGVDQVLIDQAQKGNFTNDNKLKSYYICFGTDGYPRYLESVALQVVYRNIYKGAYDPIYVATWNLLILKLSDFLVNDLQYSPKIVKDALTSCVPNNEKITDLVANDIFEFSKCFSEKGVPVDVVSANYVDRSEQDINELHDACKNQFNVDQNLINEAQNGNVADSESLGEYYTCFSVHSGILDIYGNISYDYLKNWFKLFLKQNSDKLDSALHRCYKPYLENLKEDVMQIVKCFVDEKLPLDVMVNQ